MSHLPPDNQPPIRKSRIRRLIFRIFLFLILFVLLLTASAFVGGIVFQKKLQAIYVNEINKYLKIRVDIGRMDVSLIQRFPYATVRFYDVLTKEETFSETQQPLLRAKSIFFMFNLSSLLGEEISIRKIEITEAEVHLLRLGEDRINYDILRENEDGQGKEMSWLLEALILHDVAVSYADLMEDYSVSVFAGMGNIRGRIGKDEFKAFISGDYSQLNLNVSGDHYLNGAVVNPQISFTYSFREKYLSISPSEAELNGLKTRFEGRMAGITAGDSTHIAFSTGLCKIEGVAGLLPDTMLHYIRHYRGEGEIKLKGRYLAIQDKANTMVFQMDFELEDGKATLPGYAVNLENASLKGNYTYETDGSNSGTVLSIDQCRAYIGKGEINARISYKDHGNQSMDILLQAKANLTELEEVLAPYDFKPREGKIDAALQLRLQGEDLSKMEVEEMASQTLTGTIRFKDLKAAMISSGLVIEDFSGSLELHPATSKAEFKGKAGQSDFSFKGEIISLLPAMLNTGQSILINGRLESGELVLDQFIRTDTSAEVGERADKHLEAALDFSVKKLIYKEFIAKDVSGSLDVNPQGYILSNVRFKGFNGNILANGGIVHQRNERFRSEVKVSFSNIDLRELMEQTDNLGQDNITEKHLRGRASGDIDLSMVLDEKMEIDESSINARSRLKITGGEIIEYPSLMELTRFIRAGDLSHVKIDPIENEIIIKDQKIIIPEMIVKTDVIDVSVSGTHAFDGSIDYHFRVLLSEVLGNKARKAKRENEEFGYVEEDGLGNTTLFLHLTGTTEEPRFVYDKKEVKGKIQQDLQKEKHELRELFREEFRWLRRDSLKREERRKERKKLNQEEWEFTPDWDN